MLVSYDFSSRVEENQELANYEWDQAEETGDEYIERINRKMRIAETVIRCQRLRGLERKSENVSQVIYCTIGLSQRAVSLKTFCHASPLSQNAASIEPQVAKSSGGIWSYFGFSSGSSNHNNNNNAAIQEFDPAIDNTNNNAANR